ncbi:hypothetical protein [Halosegnis longus]|uniref:hypothetical protein n=1 Tax=Halosegnis longus TaxID=2216012 RepID=UPI00117F9760|nr:hypothetical protein [Salella cibi]
MDMKRGRIRGWVEETTRPEPVSAIEAADRYGWLDATPSDRVGAAWTIAHGWVCAGGSISGPSNTVRFALGDGDPEAVLREALNTLGIETTEQGDGKQRSRELQPASDGSVFGRFLVGVLDAPHGGKVGSDLTVPSWISDSEPAVALRWLQTIVCLRGTAIDADRHGYALQLKAEQRPRAWWQGLATQIRRLCPSDAVTVAERGLLLRPEAAAVLNQPPRLPALSV